MAFTRVLTEAEQNVISAGLTLVHQQATGASACAAAVEARGVAESFANRADLADNLQGFIADRLVMITDEA